MKKLIRLVVFAALVTAFVLPALAQTTPSTATPAATQDEAQAKAELYDKFVKNRNTNPPVAYEAGKEYLQKYEAADGASDQYVSYIKKWVTSYDKLARRNTFAEQMKAKNYNEAFVTGKQLLAENPEDLPILYDLSRGGFAAISSGNTALTADTLNYAKKTIQLLQAGRTFEKDKPVTNKDEILSGLNFAIGNSLQEAQPMEAATYFINAAQIEGPFKKDPRTYFFLAAAYEKAEYAKLAPQYGNNCKTEDQIKTTECTDLKAKVDSVVDRMIDALARAIAYNDMSPNAAANAAARASWLELLTTYYKYRHEGSDTGLKELIASVTSKPMPKPGDPVAPMTTPASTTAPTQPTGTAPSGTSSNMSTAPATTTAQPKTTSTKTTP
ncbi:MAG TPA: hypothetical protein VJT09_18340 [Pyrinomonadaceae bacterium]|nr:hypothetical protein [Pyrinomonadaceae bacterium]